jgi:hypothetical protein
MDRIALWTKLFMEAQGCKIIENLVFTVSAMELKLEINGKRTSHFGLTKRKKVLIKYFSTNADYMTKPLQEEISARLGKRL